MQPLPTPLLLLQLYTFGFRKYSLQMFREGSVHETRVQYVAFEAGGGTEGWGKRFTVVLPTMLGRRPGSTRRLDPLQPHGRMGEQPSRLRLTTECGWPDFVAFV